MRGAQIISLHYNLTNKAKHAFLRERGGVGLPSTEARRMSASIVSRVGILPEVLANLTRPLGDREVRGGAESSIIAQLRGNLREIRDT